MCVCEVLVSGPDQQSGRVAHSGCTGRGPVEGSVQQRAERSTLLIRQELMCLILAFHRDELQECAIDAKCLMGPV